MKKVSEQCKEILIISLEFKKIKKMECFAYVGIYCRYEAPIIIFESIQLSYLAMSTFVLHGLYFWKT